MITEEKTESATMVIARTIINQIKYSDRMALMAWGANNFIALEITKEFHGGVQFKVNGLRFKGYVHIQLRWVDDYTVSFLNIKGEVKKQVEGVYCDMLVEVIDWIEGK